ncbi:MAG: ABC transporter ATP-binding protein, partial [Tissierellia bacterium]|nr:ABC transporter ATP-binding protein [Tissierellia bacterium]
MILSIENLHFSYPKKNILNNINFSLKEGDCLAVLGTNGVGKSTLLKCLNKILEPESGQIYLNGENVSELNGSYIAQNIAYVPQRHSYSRKTVFDSVLLGRK